MTESIVRVPHDVLGGRVMAVLNQASGSWTPSAESEVAQILESAGLSGATVSGFSPAEIDAAMADAAASAQVLIVLGGDGTIRAAAEQAKRTGAALVPLPEGL